ncbi:uncharacterized protein SOCE26_093020 [Sorangium cellulosum]|uniref:Secreted protein n=1 Tax=Sorangium cellulosum TaxID=56 RepID=A0A2L0F857_SORCE|nr:hypothetical protein [Sorangium cellulosum]AUX47778.1 uncharacterized protein SOCE26_093020 [Sorangium cellulosum]
MRLPKLRTGVALTALLGLLSTGGFCVLQDPGGPPPSPSFACSDGEPPADGEATLFFSDPEGGATPLAEDAVLPLEYGLQGGQHVTVGIRHHTAAAGVWSYRVGFERAAGEETPKGTPVLQGANTVAVNACASGWTETLTPVFINFMEDGVRDTSGNIPNARGVLRVVATHTDTDEKLSAEIPTQIDTGG